MQNPFPVCDRSALLLSLRFHMPRPKQGRSTSCACSLQWYENLDRISRGTCNRSVHRDVLSAAAFRFEATPPPPGLHWSGRASDSALHYFVEEVSPVFHHRLKFKNGLGTGTIHRAAENWQKLALASEHHRDRVSAGGTAAAAFAINSRSNRSFRHPAI